jgi:hypothetical protein
MLCINTNAPQKYFCGAFVLIEINLNGRRVIAR